MKREKIFKTIAVALIAISAASCSIQRSSYKETEVRSFEPTARAPFVNPIVADVEVVSQTKVKDSWVFTQDELFRSGIESLKVQAKAKSCQKYSADMIMASLVDVYIDDTKATITIMGYPANYTNWRTADGEKDIKWIKDIYGNMLGYEQLNTTTESQVKDAQGVFNTILGKQ